MRYNRLGKSGLFVSELALGTMNFGATGHLGPIGHVAQAEAEAMVAAALAAGVNLIDTADTYSNGASETITGTALKNLGVPRRDVIVATKVFGPMGAGPNAHGASLAHILEGVHASLDRLQLDYLDLYQIHGFDEATPIEETLRALDDLVRRGLIRYVGVSNWAAWQVAKALGISERLGVARIAALQAYYSVAGRDLERELAPMLASEGVGLLVWSPLAGGLLSGKVTRDTEAAKTTRRGQIEFPPVDRGRAFDAIDAMRAVGAAHDVSVARVALAWLLQRKPVTSVIVGAKSVAQLSDNLAASELVLTADEVATIDSASVLPAEYPGWMIELWGSARRAQNAASR